MRAKAGPLELHEAWGLVEVARGLVVSFPRRSEELHILGKKRLTRARSAPEDRVGAQES